MTTVVLAKHLWAAGGDNDLIISRNLTEWLSAHRFHLIWRNRICLDRHSCETSRWTFLHRTPTNTISWPTRKGCWMARVKTIASSTAPFRWVASFFLIIFAFANTASLRNSFDAFCYLIYDLSLFRNEFLKSFYPRGAKPTRVKFTKVSQSTSGLRNAHHVRDNVRQRRNNWTTN